MKSMTLSSKELKIRKEDRMPRFGKKKKLMTERLEDQKGKVSLKISAISAGIATSSMSLIPQNVGSVTGPQCLLSKDRNN